MVEFAIVVLPLFLIAAGILEIGLLYRSATLTSSASRSGARIASAIWATTPDGSKNTAAVDQIRRTVETDLSSRRAEDTPRALWIYRATPNGTPNGTDFSTCPATTCVQLTWDATTEHFVYASGSWTAEDACGTTIDTVGVRVALRHVSVTKLPFGNSNVSEWTTIRLEPLTFDKCNGELPL
jgi:Flp pilus assembly protein TadG